MNENLRERLYFEQYPFSCTSAWRVLGIQAENSTVTQRLRHGRVGESAVFFQESFYV